MDNFLIPLFFILFSIILYPCIMIYAVTVAGAGVSAWLIIAVMVSPYIVLWHYVVRRRMLNHIKVLLDNKPHTWDLSKTLAEYEELLKNQSNNDS